MSVRNATNRTRCDEINDPAPASAFPNSGLCDRDQIRVGLWKVESDRQTIISSHRDFCHESFLLLMLAMPRFDPTVWSGPTCVVRTTLRVGPLYRRHSGALSRARF